LPPQPLSNVYPKATIFVGAFSGRRQAELAALVAQCIATSADIGVQYGLLVTTLLQAQAKPTAAMFYALTSDVAQIAALKAAATEILGDGTRELDLFDAIMWGATDVSRRHRNKFAHWVWGYADEIPDAILFIDPEALVAHDILLGGFMQAPHHGRGLNINKIDVTKIVVYRERDIKEALEELWKHRIAYLTFGFFFRGGLARIM
jgi:hypothetical protein